LTDVQSPPTIPAPSDTASPGRTVRRRKGLPGGRAVVGGLLSAVAAVGVFAAFTAATAPPVTRYVVAAAELGPGEVIAASDLALVALDLPPDIRARSFDDIAVLTGAVTTGPLRPGELVQSSGVVDRGGAPDDRMVSFAADASRALGGRIQAGEFVDVLATYGTGDNAYTELVVGHVAVVRTSTQDTSSIGTTSTVTFTVPVPDVRAELALAHASAVGSLSVVRSGGPVGDGPRTFRPSGPEPAGTDG
jgi:Flp pilus assembly protein CpaB